MDIKKYVYRTSFLILSLHLSLAHAQAEDVAEPSQAKEVQTKLSQIEITGRMVLKDHTSLEADLIRFNKGAEIVTQGYDLVIDARATLDIAKGSRITSFALLQANKDGRNAGVVSVRAAAVTGAQLHIDNHGQDGNVGTNGADGAGGARGKLGRPGVNKGIHGCAGKVEPGQGQSGQRGFPGGAGGDAGDGGSVLLKIPAADYEGGYDRFIITQSRLNPYTNELYRCKGSCPGATGLGGSGGAGGKGGIGGYSLSGKWPCIGGGNGKRGDIGEQGKQGRQGKRGEHGTILIL